MRKKIVIKLHFNQDYSGTREQKKNTNFRPKNSSMLYMFNGPLRAPIKLSIVTDFMQKNLLKLRETKVQPKIDSTAAITTTTIIMRMRYNNSATTMSSAKATENKNRRKKTTVNVNERAEKEKRCKTSAFD